MNIENINKNIFHYQHNLNILIENYKSNKLGEKKPILDLINDIDNEIEKLKFLDNSLYQNELNRFNNTKLNIYNLLNIQFRTNNSINKKKSVFSDLINKFKILNFTKLKEKNIFNMRNGIASFIIVSGLVVGNFGYKTLKNMDTPEFVLSNTLKNIEEQKLNKEQKQVYQNIVKDLYLLKQSYKLKLNNLYKNKDIINYNLKNIDRTLKILKVLIDEQFPNNKISFNNIDYKNLPNNILDNINENLNKLDKDLDINLLFIDTVEENLIPYIKKDLDKNNHFKNQDLEKWNVFLPTFNNLTKKQQQIVLKLLKNNLEPYNIKVDLENKSNSIEQNSSIELN